MYSGRKNHTTERRRTRSWIILTSLKEEEVAVSSSRIHFRKERWRKSWMPPGLLRQAPTDSPGSLLSLRNKKRKTRLPRYTLNTAGREVVFSSLPAARDIGITCSRNF